LNSPKINRSVVISIEYLLGRILHQLHPGLAAVCLLDEAGG
jgi:hypothetical protein